MRSFTAWPLPGRRRPCAPVSHSGALPGYAPARVRRPTRVLALRARRRSCSRQILQENLHVDGRKPQGHSARPGRQDHHSGRQAERPREPDHALHRRRRHRAGHLARLRARHGRRGRQGLRRQAPHPLDGGLRRREGQQALQHLAARGDRHRLPRIPGLDQGPAHHPGRRRHPLAQRRAAADARSVRVPAPGALVQGRALAGQASGEGRHGHLPREHRGHLRGHRVRAGHRGQPEVPGAVQAGLPQGLRQDPLPGDLRHRHQAGVARRARSG